MVLFRSNRVRPIEAKQVIVFTSVDRTSAIIVDIDGDNLFPIKINKQEDGLELILTTDEPSLILYRDPKTEETTTLDICIIPPHNHYEGRGGPACGSYDQFSI